MKKVFVFMLVLVGVVLGILALQKMFSPKVNKVEYTLDDARKFETDLGIEAVKTNIDTQITPKDSVKNTGVKAVNTQIDSREATSLINLWADYWQYAPLLNSNVVVNADNTVEYSGTFDLNRAIGYANVTGVSQSVINAVKKYIQPFGTSFPIYAKGSIVITNNVVSAKITDARISAVPITPIINNYASEINSFVTEKLSADSQYSVKSLDVSNGNINVEGNFPQKVEFINSSK